MSPKDKPPRYQTSNVYLCKQVKTRTKEIEDFPRRVLEAINIRQQELSLKRDQELDLEPVWDKIIKNFSSHGHLKLQFCSVGVCAIKR